MNEKFSDFFEENIENLRIISTCPVCGMRYNSAEIILLAEKEDKHFVYIKCKKCQTSVIALILANNFGISSMGLVTDLTGEDVMKFKKLPAVNINDVIDAHQMFHKGIIKENDL